MNITNCQRRREETQGRGTRTGFSCHWMNKLTDTNFTKTRSEEGGARF